MAKWYAHRQSRKSTSISLFNTTRSTSSRWHNRQYAGMAQKQITQIWRRICCPWFSSIDRYFAWIWSVGLDNEAAVQRGMHTSTNKSAYQSILGGDGIASPIDPRQARIDAIKKRSHREKQRPYLWDYWNREMSVGFCSSRLFKTLSIPHPNRKKAIFHHDQAA